jgi:hypothetical protein
VSPAPAASVHAVVRSESTRPPQQLVGVACVGCCNKAQSFVRERHAPYGDGNARYQGVQFRLRRFEFQLAGALQMQLKRRRKRTRFGTPAGGFFLAPLAGGPTLHRAGDKSNRSRLLQQGVTHRTGRGDLNPACGPRRFATVAKEEFSRVSRSPPAIPTRSVTASPMRCSTSSRPAPREAAPGSPAQGSPPTSGRSNRGSPRWPWHCDDGSRERILDILMQAHSVSQMIAKM